MCLIILSLIFLYLIISFVPIYEDKSINSVLYLHHPIGNCISFNVIGNSLLRNLLFIIIILLLNCKSSSRNINISKLGGKLKCISSLFVYPFINNNFNLLGNAHILLQ